MNFFSELVSCIPSTWRGVSTKGNANLAKQWTLLNTQFVPGIILELGIWRQEHGPLLAAWGMVVGSTAVKLEGRRTFLFVAAKQHSISALSPDQNTSCFKPGMGKQQWGPSESQECCWGRTILTDCETWPVKGRDSSTLSTATCPVFSSISQHFLSPSRAKLGMWFVLS